MLTEHNKHDINLVAELSMCDEFPIQESSLLKKYAILLKTKLILTLFHP